MIVSEWDYVSESNNPKEFAFASRSLVVEYLGGSEGLQVADFEQAAKGGIRLVMRKRADRLKGRTFILVEDEWYRVDGVVPRPRNRLHDLVFLSPMEPDGHRLEDVTIDDQVVTIGDQLIGF